MMIASLLFSLITAEPAPACTAFNGPATAFVDQAKEISCIQVADIKAYKIIEKNRVAFTLKSGAVIEVRVVESCPDLGFHDYVGYVPVNGQLCKGSESLITREGFNCQIIGIKEGNSVKGDKG